jgi:DNA invertase Pin-like site-specific DNA recombinase
MSNRLMIMKARLYFRASTKEQDSKRAEKSLVTFASDNHLQIIKKYFENYSGTKLNRPELNQLLEESEEEEVLLVESVDRLSRLSFEDFDTLKQRLTEKKLRLVVMDLPTTHLNVTSGLTGDIMRVINSMLIDLMATMARIDQEKRVERIKQGMERAKESGKRVGGRVKNPELRLKIESYLAKNLRVEDVARLSGCGVATVYRVKREV